MWKVLVFWKGFYCEVGYRSSGSAERRMLHQLEDTCAGDAHGVPWEGPVSAKGGQMATKKDRGESGTSKFAGDDSGGSNARIDERRSLSSLLGYEQGISQRGLSEDGPAVAVVPTERGTEVLQRWASGPERKQVGPLF